MVFDDDFAVSSFMEGVFGFTLDSDNVISRRFLESSSGFFGGGGGSSSSSVFSEEFSGFESCEF